MKTENKNRKAEMYAVIEQWKGSGKSQRAICKETGVSLHIFRYWLKKQRTEQAAVNDKVNNNDSFIPVSAERPVSLPEIQIMYPNGVTIICPMPITAGQIKDLIKLF